MIKKIINWAIHQFGPKKDHVIDAWPFPVVLGTPPAPRKEPEHFPVPAKKRGRPALKKATTRKSKADSKPAVKKTSKKKAK